MELEVSNEYNEGSMSLERTASGKIVWKVKVFAKEVKECKDKLDNAVKEINTVMIDNGLI